MWPSGGVGVMSVTVALRDVVPDGGAAGQTRSPAAGVQEETSGPHRHVELRGQGLLPLKRSYFETGFMNIL